MAYAEVETDLSC